MLARITLTVLMAAIILSGGWRAAAQDGGRPVITPDNVSQLTVQQRLGQGTFDYVDWSPDGEFLAIAGSMGLWLYDAHDLEAEPRLFEAYGAKQKLTFSPNSQWVAVSMYQGAKSIVKLWDLGSGKPGLTVEGVDARFSPDSQWLAVFINVEGKPSIRLWNVTTEQQGPTFPGWTPVFSPDSRLLASRTDDNYILLRDVVTGAIIHTLEGYETSSIGFAFSPDSTLLVLSSPYGGRLWDVATGTVQLEWDDHDVSHPIGSPGAVFTPDSTQVISIGLDGTVRWWDTRTGENLHIVSGLSWPEAINFSPDGARLTAASTESGLRMWDTSTGEQLYVIENYQGWMVSFSPDSTLLASIRAVWDAATGELHATLEGSEEWSDNRFEVKFSSDNTHVIAVGLENGAIWVWDANTGQQVATYQGIYSAITNEAFSPDNNQLVSGGLGRIWLWDVETGENEQVFQSSPGYSVNYTNQVAFSPDGSTIASGNIGHIVQMLDAVTGQELHQLRSQGTGDRLHSGVIDSLTFSPDGALLAFGSYDAGVKVWDVAASKELYVLADYSYTPVSDLAFSPDSTLLARASYVGTTMVWDMATGEEVCTLAGDWSARSVAFSPDGTLLAEGGNDGSVRLWDVETCQQVSVLQGHTDQIPGLAFSPDGRLLASGSWDSTVKFWDVTTGSLLHTLNFANAAPSGVSYFGLAFSSDGTWLAVNYFGGQIWLMGIPE